MLSVFFVKSLISHRTGCRCLFVMKNASALSLNGKKQIINLFTSHLFLFLKRSWTGRNTSIPRAVWDSLRSGFRTT